MRRKNDRAKDVTGYAGYGARSRILDHGPECLDTPELLSCLLGLSVDEAHTFLNSLVEGSLRNLDLAEIRRRLTPTRAMALLAAVELGRRVFLDPTAVRPVLNSPEAVRSELHEIAYAEVEHFAVLLLDTKNRLIHKEVVSRGTLDETIAHPRDVFRAAVRQNAAGIIVAHNHPSGETSPSREDLILTSQLLECSRTLQIPLLDHVIVGGSNLTSLRRTSALWSR